MIKSASAFKYLDASLYKISRKPEELWLLRPHGIPNISWLNYAITTGVFHQLWDGEIRTDRPKNG